MPTIDVSDSTFARLQKRAVAFVDNPDTVIQRLLDSTEGADPKNANGTVRPAPSAVNFRDFDPTSPPNLTHTKLLAAKFNTKDLVDVTWNGLLVEAIRFAKMKARTDDELRRLITVNFSRGRKEDEGYHYYQDIGLSVQGQDANGAWEGARHIARQLSVPIGVEFVWRMKDKAAHPGVAGRLSA